MMTPKMLTLRGQTMSIAEWSRQPGAAKFTTIYERLTVAGWAPEKAVFTPARSFWSKRRPNRPSRGMHAHLTIERPPLRLAPNPRLANPLRPCVGGFKSWPLEAIEMLRRCA